ncbi:hypothetical protein K438DRAFT_1974987 [Mycena galopus ATCC 62051]|nr:hypothetical protein K438DRAFT_1974987 [Mycena galopus ATCC 62051]
MKFILIKLTSKTDSEVPIICAIPLLLPPISHKSETGCPWAHYCNGSLFALPFVLLAVRNFLALVNEHRLVIAPDSPSPLKFAASKWIWSSTTATANAFVAFHKDFTPPVGKALIAEEIIITPYAELTLYVNGVYIDSRAWPTSGFPCAARRYYIACWPACIPPDILPCAWAGAAERDDHRHRRQCVYAKYLINFASFAVLATNTVASPRG